MGGEVPEGGSEAASSVLALPTLALNAVTYAHSFGEALAYGLTGNAALYWVCVAQLAVVVAMFFCVRRLLGRARREKNDE